MFAPQLQWFQSALRWRGQLASASVRWVIHDFQTCRAANEIAASLYSPPLNHQALCSNHFILTQVGFLLESYLSNVLQSHLQSMCLQISGAADDNEWHALHVGGVQSADDPHVEPAAAVCTAGKVS